MDIEKYTRPSELLKYSFLWSITRLVIAALALFLGGIPPIYKIIQYGAYGGIFDLLLKLCWIISGVASVYLLYEWTSRGQMLFRAKKQEDLILFLVMIVSGINLGLVSIIGKNIGMSILSNRIIFIAVGLLYLYVAYDLFTKWQKNGNKLI